MPRWSGSPVLSHPLSAVLPHMLQNLAGGPAAEALARMESERAPVHKLDWRLDATSGYWRQILDALSDRLSQPPGKPAAIPHGETANLVCG